MRIWISNWTSEIQLRLAPARKDLFSEDVPSSLWPSLSLSLFLLFHECRYTLHPPFPLASGRLCTSICKRAEFSDANVDVVIAVTPPRYLGIHCRSTYLPTYEHESIRKILEDRRKGEFSLQLGRGWNCRDDIFEVVVNESLWKIRDIVEKILDKVTVLEKDKLK